MRGSASIVGNPLYHQKARLNTPAVQNDPMSCGKLDYHCPRPAHGHAMCTEGECAFTCEKVSLLTTFDLVVLMRWRSGLRGSRWLVYARL